MVRTLPPDPQVAETDAFEDFSVASPWERLIADLEAALRAWGLARGGTPVASVPSAPLTKQVAMDEDSYVLTLYSSPDEHAAASRPDSVSLLETSARRSPGVAAPASAGPSLCASELQLLRVADFPLRAHWLRRWFGLATYAVLAPVNDAGADPSTCHLLLSALTIAATSCACTVPLFVPREGKFRGLFAGMAVHQETTTRYDVRLTTSVPVTYSHLSGLVDDFISRLGMPTATASDAVVVSTRFTYVVEMDELARYRWLHSDDKQRSQVPFLPHSPRSAGGDSSGGAGSASGAGAAAAGLYYWGCDEDPVDALHLAVEWPSMPAHKVWDNPVFTQLNPHQAMRWQLRPLYPRMGNTRDFHLTAGIAALTDALREAAPLRAMEDLLGAAAHPQVAFLDAMRSLQAPSSGSIKSIQSLGNAEQLDLALRHCFDEQDVAGLPQEVDTLRVRLKAAPPASMLAVLAAHMAQQANLRAMALLWVEFVREVRWHWEHRHAFHRMDPRAPPDWSSCIIQQKLQIIAICIARASGQPGGSGGDDDTVTGTGRARSDTEASTATPAAAAAGAPTAATGNGDDGSSDDDDDVFYEASEEVVDQGPDGDWLGETDATAAPLGREKLLGDGAMLVKYPDRPIWVPVVQESRIQTEDQFLAQEAVFARMGDGSDASAARARQQSQSLVSDMQAFKAANPGCTLHDFVRWHSPRDWSAYDELSEADKTEACAVFGSKEAAQRLGMLSARMRGPANLWQRLWHEASVSPVTAQQPLFDVESEAEMALHYLDTLPPVEMLLQLANVYANSCVHALLGCTGSQRLASVANAVHAAADTVARILAVSEPGTSAAPRVSAADCQTLGQAVAEAEVVCSRASSLLAKLGDDPALVEALLLEDEVDLAADQRASTHEFFAEHRHWSPEARRSAAAATVPGGASTSLAPQRGVNESGLPPTSAREFILRSLMPRPQTVDDASAHRMYVLLGHQQFRVATALSSSTHA